MDEQGIRGLVDHLRARIAGLRAAREHTPGLMPDAADLVRVLSPLAAEVGVGIDPRFFWVIVGFLLYGDTDVDFAPARVEHAVGYLCRWERRNGSIVFRDAALLQLVFLYALGIRRPPGAVAGETPEQAAAWGCAPWNGAFDALRWYLIGLAGWLIAALRRVGFRALEMLGVFVGDAEGHSAHRITDHTIGVLFGHTRCLCAPLFRDVHPGTPGDTPERRHERWHLLTGYLDKHWPEGRRYHLRPFGISEHVFRAVCGDDPTRPRALETGIWFWLIRSSGASLVVLKVLACRGCRNHLAQFDVCSECGTAWPENLLVDWLATEEDARFRPGEGKECRRCGRLAPLEQSACPCGSPGAGFSRTIRGTGQVECVTCRQRVRRGVHACPHAPCLNADYGGETHFYFRQQAPDHFGPGGPSECGAPGGPHKGGAHRKPLARRDQPEEPDDSPPESPDRPDPERPTNLPQTPPPALVASPGRGRRKTERSPVTGATPETGRPRTSTADAPEGSNR